MNYGYNNTNYINPYGRNYNMPNYGQPQYAPQPQQVSQPQMAQPQQSIQYEMPIQYVGNGTLKETEAYILFPNQKAFFIDKANGMVYEKVCGANGQSEITHYKKHEPQGENQAIETPKEQPTIDLSSYVERKELGAFASLKQLNELNSKIEELKKMIGGRQNNGTNKQQWKVPMH